MQAVELKASKILHVGLCDNSAGNYPIAKKKQTLEALREKAHLRPRTNTIGAVARIRNALAFATHEFFQSAGFLYVHTPIVTTSDCEGAGEMFQVSAPQLQGPSKDFIQVDSESQGCKAVCNQACMQARPAACASSLLTATAFTVGCLATPTCLFAGDNPIRQIARDRQTACNFRRGGTQA